MTDRVFLDTNVWVYAATGQEAYPDKCAQARAIVASRNIGVSPQVVGEFLQAVQNPRKMRRPLTEDEAADWVARFLSLPCVELDREIVETALRIRSHYRIRYWDSQIIAAAERFGATVLFSEDLSHLQTYNSLRCENPFRTH
jgi:predicted nucleic acid-binding protein